MIILSKNHKIIITTGTAHIKNINQASTQQIRRMTQKAITKACDDAKKLSFKPITMVDDLSMHSLGPWIKTFAKCLSRSAKRENISIIGGEMSQMKSIYKFGYIGIFVSIISIKPLDI